MGDEFFFQGHFSVDSLCAMFLSAQSAIQKEAHKYTVNKATRCTTATKLLCVGVDFFLLFVHSHSCTVAV